MTSTFNPLKLKTLLSGYRGTIMQKTLKMPSHDELVDLSNAELARRTRMAKQDLDQAYERGEMTTEKARIYRIFEYEHVRRLKFGETADD